MTSKEPTNSLKKIKASDHELYGTMTIMSLLLPFVGMIVGIAYLTKEAETDRKLGEHLIACSVLAGIASTIIWITWVPIILR